MKGRHCRFKTGMASIGRDSAAHGARAEGRGEGATKWRRAPEATMAALRRALSGAWRPPPPPSHRGFARPAGPPSSRQLREADEAAPVFQYAGKAARRRGRVFVWGFCLAGALGVPSFVRPDASWKRPRRVQPTPYRLETDGKVPAGGGRSVATGDRGVGGRVFSRQAPDSRRGVGYRSRSG